MMNQDTLGEASVVDIVEENCQKFLQDDKSRGKSPSSCPKPKIQEVPARLGNNKNLAKFFRPKIVSFGPIYHCRRPECLQAEYFKKYWAVKFTKMTGQNVESIKERMKENIDELKIYFASDELWRYNDDEDEKLAEILSVDGCALLYYIECIVQQKYDYLEITPDQRLFVAHDMFLLGNQLPFRVLDLLIAPNHMDAWMKKIEIFFARVVSLFPVKQGNVRADLKDKRPTHLLELLRESLLGSKPQGEVYRSDDHDEMKEIVNPDEMKKLAEGYPLWDSLRSVAELKASGVKFKENKKCRDVDDIISCRGCSLTVEIPHITIDDSSWSLLMNLIAYEMCWNGSSRKIISYVSFLDKLIDHPEDVKELRKAKILTNHLRTDKELSQLFNEIGIYLTCTDRGLNTIRMEIRDHCDNWWKTQFGEFCNTYFSSPWSLTAFIAAFIMAALTIVQTYFTIWPLKDM